MGAQNVRLLNGDWQKWQAEEREIVSGENVPVPIENEPGFVRKEGVILEMEDLFARKSVHFDTRNKEGWEQDHVPGTQSL